MGYGQEKEVKPGNEYGVEVPLLHICQDSACYKQDIQYNEHPWLPGTNIRKELYGIVGGIIDGKSDQVDVPYEDLGDGKEVGPETTPMVRLDPAHREHDAQKPYDQGNCQDQDRDI